MRGFCRFILRFQRNRSGVVAVITAMCLPIFIGFSALALDMSYAYWMRNQLQIAADSSALAGASQLEFDKATITAEAIQYAQINIDAQGRSSSSRLH